MSALQEGPYPGAAAGVDQIADLANAYYTAALVLLRSAETEAPLSMAPARLCAMHAIELYLNAFLRHQGVPAAQVRARMHNLADPAAFAALGFRRRTEMHLSTMSETREYLISRYAPEQIRQHTEINRLQATLVEVMTKVGKHLRR